MDDEFGLRQQFGLEVCPDCGFEECDGDICNCDYCVEVRAEQHEEDMRDSYD